MALVRRLTSAAFDRFALVAAVFTLGLILALPGLHSAGISPCDEEACCHSHGNHPGHGCDHDASCAVEHDGHDECDAGDTPCDHPHRHDPTDCPICKVMLVMQATVIRLPSLVYLFRIEPSRPQEPPTIAFAQFPAHLLSHDARGPPMTFVRSSLLA
jgi:hypothetical protein